MKIYMVEYKDTNGLTSALKAFQNRHEAEQYVDEQEKIHKALQFYIRERNPETLMK